MDFNSVPTLKGSKHRVFFQNAEGNINMGVFFNDPDVDLDEIFWYNELAMDLSRQRNKGLISIDEELNTRSCYVELHRIGLNQLIIRLMSNHSSINWRLPCESHPVGSNGRNNIIIPTPMKFLPVTEFENRQKSINRNQNLAIMRSAMTKIGF